MQPDIRLVYIGQTGGVLLDLPVQHPAIDAVYAVRAGKLRRYAGEGWRQLFDFHTQALNVRDAFRVLIGIWQSYWLIRRLRPSVIFTRGGYVSVPVALAGKACGVPYITHDSDSTPSLANRLIARWAARHAVALPAELYPYPPAKTIVTGVPVAGEYQPVDTKLQRSYKQDLGLKSYTHVLFITGGGNGAASLNMVAAEAVCGLVHRHTDLAVVHLTGRNNDSAVNKAYGMLPSNERKRISVLDFTTELYKYSGAADVIITRGGASSLAEFAVQHKACIVIPASQLFWQGRHAAALAQQHAILVLDESAAAANNTLADTVDELLDNRSERVGFSTALGNLAHPDAAKQLAMLLLEQIPAHRRQ